MTMNTIPLIDVFAGPGGLNEGFSRLGEPFRPVFSTVASFEMESAACRTLTLRGVYRTLLRGAGVPESYYQFIRGEINESQFRDDKIVEAAWYAAESHINEIELGPDSREESDSAIRAALLASSVSSPDSPWALIGGPPCQAYSLAGRSRRTNDVDFENDKKHFLYEEYLHILREFAPPVFVMENVKGLLSSTHSGMGMFDRIKNDLENPRDGLNYEIYSLTSDAAPGDAQPSDFIIRSEKYGIPQRRHRVILLGLRRDFFGPDVRFDRLKDRAVEVSVAEAFAGMPKVRSGLSPAKLDTEEEWTKVRSDVANSFGGAEDFTSFTRGGKSMSREGSARSELSNWLIDEDFPDVIQHETRAHMRQDLERYWFAATRAAESGVSPSLRDFPERLLPNHANVASRVRPFEDRFRVQVTGRASSTVVSHIAKDGHYYIHPDPSQMRALTVREAARLQTFPDNYFFMGNRTQQYHQVGNAVPPLLANQIAAVVAGLFGDKSVSD